VSGTGSRQQQSSGRRRKKEDEKAEEVEEEEEEEERGFITIHFLNPHHPPSLPPSLTQDGSAATDPG